MIREAVKLGKTTYNTGKRVGTTLKNSKSPKVAKTPKAPKAPSAKKTKIIK